MGERERERERERKSQSLQKLSKHQLRVPAHRCLITATSIFFSSVAQGGKKELDPIMIKLDDLASSGKKKQVLAIYGIT